MPARNRGVTGAHDPLEVLHFSLRERRETLDGCRGRPFFRNGPSPEESLQGRMVCLGDLGLFSGSGMYEGREIVGRDKLGSYNNLFPFEIFFVIFLSALMDELHCRMVREAC